MRSRKEILAEMQSVANNLQKSNSLEQYMQLELRLGELTRELEAQQEEEFGKKR